MSNDKIEKYINFKGQRSERLSAETKPHFWIINEGVKVWNRWARSGLSNEEAKEYGLEGVKAFTKGEKNELVKAIQVKQREWIKENGNKISPMDILPPTDKTIDFSGVTFTKEANFRGAKFIEEAAFSGAKFIEVAIFSDAKFTGVANFSGAKFTKWAIFSDAKFTGSAYFSGAKFTKEAYFSDTNFTGSAYFSGTTFTKEANFSGTTFIEEVGFRGAKFIGVANFSDAKFTEEADFSGAKFTGSAYFSGTTFTKEAYFSGTTFTEEVGFRGAKFIGMANFSDATFTEEANFSGTTFTKEANFSGTTFTEEVDFSGTTFTEEVDFSDATFTEEANFSGATFTKEVDFSGATFEKIATFRKVNFSYSPIFFTATFTGQMDFREIDWSKTKSSGDSLLLDEINSFGQLRHEMNIRQNHDMELEFFALELESKEKYSKTTWLKKKLIGLYRISCDYGQSIIKPLKWLGVAIASFFAIYFILLFGANIENYEAVSNAAYLSFSHSIPIIPLDKAVYSEVRGLISHSILSSSVFQIARFLQYFISIILLFLIALGMRNFLRLK